MIARACVLYRFFNKSGELLYVGITANPRQRFRAHEIGKPWWDQVADIKLEHCPSRAALIEAERQAIADENPRYNIYSHSRERVDTREAQTMRGHRLQEIVDAGLAESVRSLQDQIRAKKIPAHKSGRHWYLTDSDLEEALGIWASKPQPRVTAPQPLSLTSTSLRRQRRAS